MENVKDKQMYLIIKDTPLNRKYHNYKLGDICDDSKKHNEKYVNFKKSKIKIFKTKGEKKTVFMEKLHEKVRKKINPLLPSRLNSIILYGNINDCIELSLKWEKNSNTKVLGFYKVKCDGILHACATTPDEKKPKNLTEKAHIDGITRFWKGDKTAKTQEYFFKGKAEIIEILTLPKK